MMHVTIVPVWDLDDGVQVGYDCRCGSCQPTASIFQHDPDYERHDRRLADGPCCCGRFFVVGHDAQARAEALSQELQRIGQAPAGHVFHVHTVILPWGGVCPAVVADLSQFGGAT